MKIMTWNINSIRLRLPLLVKLLVKHQPDVICLQETKVPDHLFPEKELHEIGYSHTAFRGEKGYNGVAIVSKHPLSSVKKQCVADIEDSRHISAHLPDGMIIHNFYVPAGGELPDPEKNPKFRHKLDFVDYLSDWLPSITKESTPSVLVGDFNIAPQEHDVWSHKQLLDVISHTPIEVEKLTRLQQTLNWTDVGRHFVDADEKLYSWWSYRNRDWKKSNRGRRLDHIWVTPSLKPRLEAYETLTYMRDSDRPSDHVPVMATLS